MNKASKKKTAESAISKQLSIDASAIKKHQRAEDYFRAYSNYAQSSFTNTDISVTFCELDGAAAPLGDEEPIIRHLGRITMGPQFTLSTVKMLLSSLIQWSEKHGSAASSAGIGLALTEAARQLQPVLERQKGE